MSTSRVDMGITPEGTEAGVPKRKLPAEEALRGDKPQLRSAGQQVEEEEQLPQIASIVESLNHAIVIFSFDEVIESWSPAAERAFGYTAEEAIGKPVSVLIPEAQKPEWRQVLQTLRGGKSVSNIITRRLHRSGRELWVTMNLSLVLSREGKAASVCAVTEDITQQKETIDKLQRSEMLLRESQSIAHIGSFSYSIESEKMAWSDEMYCIHGYTPGGPAPTLRHIISHACPSDKERVEVILNRALQNMEDYAFTMLYVTPDGEERYIHNIGRFVADAGLGVRLVGTAQDITSLKQAEAEVKQKNLALQQTNERLLKEIEERKKAEAALKETEEKWRTLVDNTPDVITRFNRGLRFVFANSSVQQKLGLTPPDIVGKTYAELDLPEEISRESMASISRVFETGERASRYITLDTAAGRKEFYSISVPETDETGNVKTVLNISRDVTEVKQKESLLQAVLNSSHSGIGAIKAIRDEHNRIVDFSFLHANKKAQILLQRTPEQLQNLTLLQLLPGYKESGLSPLFNNLSSRFAGPQL